MGYARVQITPELLLDVLHFPPDTRIVGADMDHSHGYVVLTMAHPDLKDGVVDDRGCPPVTTPTLRAQPPVVFESWGQD